MSVSEDWLGGSETFKPAFHPGLLIQMAIHHDVPLGSSLCWHSVEYHRRASSFASDDFPFDSLDLYFLYVLINHINRFLNLSIGQVLLVYHRREIWLTNEILQAFNIPAIPKLLDISQRWLYTDSLRAFLIFTSNWFQNFLGQFWRLFCLSFWCGFFPHNFDIYYRYE